MTVHRVVRTESDIAAIEREGFSAFLPHASPFQLIEATAARYPDRPAIRYLTRVGVPETDVTLNYEDFAGRIRQAANLFRRLGVTAHDAIAILAPHVLSTQIALWGGGSRRPRLPDQPDAGARAYRRAAARGRGEDRDRARRERRSRHLAKLVPALREAGFLTHILDCDADRPSAGSDGRFEAMIARENADALDFAVEGGADEIAAFFHTGGTTGAPKLALHTRGNQAFVGRSAALMYDLSPDDVLINGFPLFHVAGAFVYGLSVFAAGASIVIPTRLGMRNRAFVGQIWKQVARCGVTIVGGMPTVISALIAVPIDADILRLRLMLTGGSPLPAELADAFERTIGKPVRNLLGMTECAGVVTVEPFRAPRTVGSTGLRLPFTDVGAFHATDQGIDFQNPCPPGETGIIALRGPNVSPGYSDPKRNAGTFEAGWLVSGDLGHVDAEGRVFVTGRAKDVIIRGGHNIDPAIIEDALLLHPDVAIAAAVGQPDPYAGELPVAYVTLKAGAKADAESLLAFVAPRVGEPAARPRSIGILGEMPVTPIGKIYKPALRVLATKRVIEEMLTTMGLCTPQCEVTVTERETIVRLKDAAREDAVKAALLGMPIRYSIQAGVA